MKTNPIIRNFGNIYVILLMAGWVGCSGKMSPEMAQEKAQQGIDALRILDYSAAYDLLKDSVSRMSEDSPIYIQAKYAQALAYWHHSPPSQKSVTQAVVLLKEMLKRDDLKTELRGQIKIDLGRIFEIADYPGDEKHVEEARAQYEEVIREFEGMDVGCQAALRLGGTYSKLQTREGYRESIKILSRSVVKAKMNKGSGGHELDGWKSIASDEMGDLYWYGLGEPRPALEAYIRAYHFGLTQPEKEDRHCWKIAKCAEAAEIKKDAIKYYTMVANMPRSMYHTEAAKILKDTYGIEVKAKKY